MDHLFSDLHEHIKNPLRIERGVKTDSSVVLIYPPERELDFREHLLDTFIPEVEAKKLPHRVVDLSGFLFSVLSEAQIEALEEDEFDDYRFMKQGLSKRAEAALHARLTDEAGRVPGGNVVVYATVALYPLVRYGDVLNNLRDLTARIILAFPGEERGGKLHFMNHPDGANYLAVKLFAR